MPDRQRVLAALENAEKQLVDRKHGLIKLFSDGFREDRRAGYISAYPVGLRENGGQYTHAAVWLARSFIENGQWDKGYELLCILNPLNKYDDESTAKRYMTEPYFLAGDVYYANGVEGRGGWSIYTGSAGWYYKTVIEDVFGLRKCGDRLYVNPRFPTEWNNCSLTLISDGREYNIEYFKNSHEGLFVDGKKSEYISLDGKAHKIIVNFCGNN
jgi:cyclic beta-1,2-glucan synthetase